MIKYKISESELIFLLPNKLGFVAVIKFQITYNFFSCHSFALFIYSGFLLNLLSLKNNLCYFFLSPIFVIVLFQLSLIRNYITVTGRLPGILFHYYAKSREVLNTLYLLWLFAFIAKD